MDEEDETAGLRYPLKRVQRNWGIYHFLSSRVTCRGTKRCWDDTGELEPGPSGPRSISALMIFCLVLNNPSNLASSKPSMSNSWPAGHMPHLCGLC